MLLCTGKSNTSTDEDLLPSQQNYKNENKFIFPDGITPPMENVINRRFRKAIKTDITNEENNGASQIHSSSSTDNEEELGSNNTNSFSNNGYRSVFGKLSSSKPVFAFLFLKYIALHLELDHFNY